VRCPLLEYHLQEGPTPLLLLLDLQVTLEGKKTRMYLVSSTSDWAGQWCEAHVAPRTSWGMPLREGPDPLPLLLPLNIQRLFKIYPS